MLHYFRINDPYRIIGLLIVLLLLYAPILIDVPALTFPELKTLVVGDKVRDGSALYTGLIDSTAPLSGWFFAFANMIFGDSLLARHILAFVILFIEAVLLGIIFIDKKAFPDSSFIPSLMFGILCLFSFDTVSLSGELVGTFFLLMALNSLFREIEFREENYEMVLRTGLFIGIGSLFEFSFTLYVFAVLGVLILFTRTSGRKIFLLITGYLLPHFLLVSIYFIKGGVGELWNYFYVPNLSFSHVSYVRNVDLLKLLAVPVFFFVAAIIVLNRESRFTKYQSQLLQVMFFWTIFSFLQAFFSKEFRPHSFIPALIGMSFFISHFFLIVMRRRFAELAFWIFIGGIGFMSYSSLYAGEAAKYDQLVVPPTDMGLSGKKIVVLADSVEIYSGNRLSTPFLNWKLSGEIFKQPEYYDHVGIVYDGFRDRPDLIIDPSNLMAPFLDRIPELRREYTRSPEGYRRIN